MDGQGFSAQNVGDTALGVAGRGIGAIAALADLWAHRDPMRLLEARSQLMQDPGFRSQAGPFMSGLLWAGGSRQPVDLAPGGPSAPERAFVPNFGQLPPRVDLQNRLAQTEAQFIQNATPEQQQMIGQLGLKLPLTPEQRLAPYANMIGPGGARLRQLTVPGLGKLDLTDPNAAATPIPGAPGYMRDPVTGRPLRTEKLGGGPGVQPPATPFKKWQQEHPTGSVADFWSDEARAAAQKQAATVAERPAAQSVEQEMEQLNTLDGLIEHVRGLLKDPEVQKGVGALSGRIGFAEYKAGILKNPAEIEFNTLRELIRVLSVGRLARSAGSRSYLIWRELDVHPPQAGDNVVEIQKKLDSLQGVLRDTAKNAAKAAGTPRGRLGELVPGSPAAPTAPAAPAGGAEMQTTPGGNSYRILEP